MVDLHSKVVPISNCKSPAERLSDLAYELWLTKFFENGGTPQDALFRAAAELNARGLFDPHRGAKELIRREPCRIISIDSKTVRLTVTPKINH